MATLTLFDHATPTPVLQDADSSLYTLGVSFIVKVAGTIDAVSFYRNPNDPVTSREVALFARGAGATSLRTGTSSGETGSGWKTVSLSSPITVTPNTEYIAAVLFLGQHYVANGGYFNTNGGQGYEDANFIVPNTETTQPIAGGTSLMRNGLFNVGSTIREPVNEYNAANYFIDIAFTPAGGTIAGTAALTEQGDTVVFAGVAAKSGVAAITLSGDALSASAKLLIAGNANLAEADDTATAIGQLALRASAALQEAGDYVDGSASLALAGVASSAEEPDGVQATGSSAKRGSLAAVEGDDTVAATGYGYDGSASLAPVIYLTLSIPAPAKLKAAVRSQSPLLLARPGTIKVRAGMRL